MSEAAGPKRPITVEVLRAAAVIQGLEIEESPFNIVGLPAIAIPCGFSSLNVPVSFQVGSAALAEPLLLRIARAFLRQSGVRGRYPDLDPDRRS